MTLDPTGAPGAHRPGRARDWTIHELSTHFLRWYVFEDFRGGAAMAAHKKQRDAARDRARHVLFSLIDEENQRRLDQEGYIEVIGSCGTRFRLYANDWQGNIVVCDATGEPAGRSCAHPQMWDGEAELYAPIEDALIVQLLALRRDERAVGAIAVPMFGLYPPNGGR